MLEFVKDWLAAALIIAGIGAVVICLCVLAYKAPWIMPVLVGVALWIGYEMGQMNFSDKEEQDAQ